MANAFIAGGLLAWVLAGTLVWAISLLERSGRYARRSGADAFYALKALELANTGTWLVQCQHAPDRMHLSARAAEMAGLAPNPHANLYESSVWRDAVVAAGEARCAASAHETLQQALSGAIERYDTVYALKRPADGAIVWLREIAERVRDPDTGQAVLLAALQDVTDLTLARNAAPTKPAALANMGHELRTPLNAILGLAHLALKTNLRPVQSDFVKKIQASGQHLLGLINDVIDFSSIESGQIAVEEADFTLSQVIENMVHLAGEKLQGKDIELIVNVNTAVPDRLNGDSSRLAQILNHYVDNAIKFTQRGEVAVEVYPLEQSSDALLLRFDVRDTGIGLTAAQTSSLFQGAHQGDASATRPYGGNGLGLAICGHLVGLMHGEVGVESEIGVGSNFWFTARLKKAADQPPSPVIQPDLRGRRALVVDDNEHARLVMLDLLNDMTLMVDAADGADAAIAALTAEDKKNDPYEIVFLDWQMPGMDGIDLARWISAMALKHTPRMVMVTAYGRQEILATAREAGIDDVLIKPVNPATLLSATLHAMRGEPQAVAPASDAIQDVAAALKARSGARILVAEDNPVNQQVIGEILTDAGFVVELVDNGRQAVDRLANTPETWDLVLMDMQMPVMDGISATIEIRNKQTAARLPIVAMTASAMRQDQDRCLQAGMQDFVSKPIDPEVLERLLIKWILPRTPAPAAASKAGSAGAIEGLETRIGLHQVHGEHASYVLGAVTEASDTHAPLSIEIVTTQLLQLLDDDDASAPRLFEQYASLFQAHYPEHFHALDIAIKNYEFWDAAQQLANAVVTTSPNSQNGL